MTYVLRVRTCNRLPFTGREDCNSDRVRVQPEFVVSAITTKRLEH
jgi:hypothetical protein